MKPTINVTPLIDVLLVLLIIFMVVVPEKPTNFRTHIPGEPQKDVVLPQNPNTLIVFVGLDGSIRLNSEVGAATVDDPAGVIASLAREFRHREANGVFRPGTNEIERTVFVSAACDASYGTVVKAIDAVSKAGADPVGLKIDGVN
jgi:biopolymer transport protein ExbD